MRIRYDPALPIVARRDEIRAALERHPVVIVCGETGSGKTTQLPKMLLEMGGEGKRAGRIGHTQPRRIAARPVSGRLYPVEVRYRPVGGDSEDTTRDEEEAALADAVDELCREGPGDILVFLPGEREIRDAADTLRRHGVRQAEILPLYARLSAAEQDRVFKPAGARRIVLATNVAETSLTVPRIRYVVDTGDARLKRYSYRNKVEMLRVEPISQAAARQRAGRCGRVANGVCIRLYPEEDFAKRPAFTDPELLRSSLASA